MTTERQPILSTMPAYDVPSKEEHIWYLAYGSNMSTKTLTGRRKVHPLTSFPCRVPGAFLSFDTGGLPYQEPTFAAIFFLDRKIPLTESYARQIHARTACNASFHWDPSQPEASLPPEMHGVVHKITKQQYEHIRNTEGGGGRDDVEHGYSDVVVECVGYDGRVVEARTLMGRSKAENMQPSARYLQILMDGAKEHGLEVEYQKYLEGLVPYRVRSLRTKVGKMLFIGLILPLTTPYFAMIMLTVATTKVENSKKQSLLAVTYQGYLMRLVRLLHEGVFKPLFGSGVDTIEDGVACR